MSDKHDALNASSSLNSSDVIGIFIRQVRGLFDKYALLFC